MKVMLVVNTDGALYRFRKPIIEALIAQGNEVVTVSEESTYFEHIRALGARPISLKFGRHSISPLANLLLLARLYSVIRKERPHIIHGFTHKAAIFASIAGKLAGTSGLFVTITGLGSPFSSRGLKTLLLRQIILLQYRIAMSFVNIAFFQNPDDLDLFVSQRIVNKKKAVLTNGSGVDLAEFRLPSACDIRFARESVSAVIGQNISDKILVLFTARGVPEKGLFEFYDAARRINELVPNSYIFIHLGLIDSEAGGFKSTSEIEAFAQRSGVYYLGFVEDVRLYLSAADIMVLPSWYREGTPRSLIEALAKGLPIITTRTPGCKETVMDGWNGFYILERRGAAVAAMILKVDAKFRASARLRSRVLCEQLYDVRKLVTLTLAAYQSADSGRK